METQGWRFDGVDTPAVLFFGACLLLFMLTITYVVMQYHFLRYLQKESKSDYEQLGSPDPFLRMTQDGGYFPFDRYIFSKRYQSLQNALALQMAKRIRALLFTVLVLTVFVVAGAVFLY